jgi:glycerophosphoryl diester phosphodiesterase
LLGFGQGKVVIGHRGAAGYLPEETLAGYAFGYALGADYLEPDLVMTQDGQFICLHDIYLEPTTNVEQLFPDRRRSDGHWYAIDFTLAEIKTLAVHERCESADNPYFPDRFPVGRSHFEVPTFAEMIELVQGLNKSTGRHVGIYPELKRPSWHAQQGLPMEQALLDILAAYGYSGPDANLYVQCFEPDSLKTLRNLGAEFPLIQLVSASWSYASMWSEKGLDDIATYADGIGPSKTIIESDPAYVEWAHARGLVVHPYTFRKDQLPSKYASLAAELEQFYFVYDVDGVFTDFADIAVDVLGSKG